jgi:hypothetical protein
MKNKIQKRIDELYKDLEDYHQNTFETWNYEPYKNKKKLTGKEINSYIYDKEMTRQEDACYIAGEIDILEQLEKETL